MTYQNHRDTRRQRGQRAAVNGVADKQVHHRVGSIVQGETAIVRIR